MPGRSPGNIVALIRSRTVRLQEQHFNLGAPKRLQIGFQRRRLGQCRLEATGKNAASNRRAWRLYTGKTGADTYGDAASTFMKLAATRPSMEIVTISATGERSA